MTTDDQPAPETTLAILLGASKYPESETWEENRCFARSANAFHEYLQQTWGLREGEQILNLFDSKEGADPLDRKIASFLDTALAKGEEERTKPRDLLVYYVGHGCPNQMPFCLSLNSTRDDSVLVSSLAADTLLRTVERHAHGLRSYFILDCCFARKFLRSAQAAEGIVAQQFWGDHTRQGLGLLSAASEREVAIGHPEDPYTLFTGALLNVLSNGSADISGCLPLRGVWTLTRKHIQDLDVEYKPMPHLDSPRHEHGDVADMPLFPNPANPSVPQESFEDAMTRVLGNYQQIVQKAWQARWSEELTDDRLD